LGGERHVISFCNGTGERRRKKKARKEEGEKDEVKVKEIDNRIGKKGGEGRLLNPELKRPFVKEKESRCANKEEKRDTRVIGDL